MAAQADRSQHDVIPSDAAGRRRGPCRARLGRAVLPLTACWTQASIGRLSILSFSSRSSLSRPTCTGTPPGPPVLALTPPVPLRMQTVNCVLITTWASQRLNAEKYTDCSKSELRRGAFC